MGDDRFAALPPPPYYTVIFSSRRREGDHGYDATAQRMVELAATQPGFLGIEHARDPDGFGITVSYWESEAAIAAWKRQVEHGEARRRGREDWYARFELRVARVERAYGGPRQAAGNAADAREAVEEDAT
jgi:heme-degrading monooxygenase HmoA